MTLTYLSDVHTYTTQILEIDPKKSRTFLSHLVLVLTLGHHLISDLDLGHQHGLEEVSSVQTQQEGHLLSLCITESEVIYPNYSSVATKKYPLSPQQV
jgi:hypothetical protein